MVYDNSPICPNCGGITHYYDRTKRIVKGKNGEKHCVYVYRYVCRTCGQIHRVIPNSLVPFKHYEKEIIDGVLEGFITPDTLGFEDYPNELTMKRWKKENEDKNIFISMVS